MFKNISWAQGFFRLWVVYGLIVVFITGVYIYYEKPYRPSRIMLYFEKPDSFKVVQDHAEIRVDTKKKKIFDELIRRGEISTYKIEGDTLGFRKDVSKNTRELKISEYRKDYQISYDKILRDERMKTLTIGFGFLIIPLLIGLVIKWILKGFIRKEAN